jgi:hypothetical protein
MAKGGVESYLHLLGRRPKCPDAIMQEDDDRLMNLSTIQVFKDSFFHLIGQPIAF